MSTAAALHRSVRDRLARRPLVVLLDVDGTLSAIAPTPGAAFVSPATTQAVTRLAATPDVHVALVSGRAARDARRLVAAEGVWAVGNHGFERIAPDGTVDEDPALAPWQGRVAAAAAAVAPIVARHHGAILENKTWTLSVHFRQAAADAEAPIGAALASVAADHGLALLTGKKVFELRPSVDVNKGTASVALAEALLGDRTGAVFYAGDDRTDEDAFRALRAAWPHAVTVRVAPMMEEAPADSAAEFLLPDVDAMGAFLALLAGAGAGEP